MTSQIVLLVAAFFLGSIPSALLMARRRGVDLRASGSGNPGATNVYRILGPRDGLLVLAADIVKGVLAVGLMRWSGAAPGWWLGAGAAAILGHTFSPLMGFRGGKGVATGGGVVLALTPLTGLIVLLVFAIGLATTRMVSVGSILAAIALPITIFLLDEPVPGLFWAGCVIGGPILIRHRSNLVRIVQGEEKRFKVSGGDTQS